MNQTTLQGCPTLVFDICATKLKKRLGFTLQHFCHPIPINKAEPITVNVAEEIKQRQCSFISRILPSFSSSTLSGPGNKSRFRCCQQNLLQKKHCFLPMYFHGKKWVKCYILCIYCKYHYIMNYMPHITLMHGYFNLTSSYSWECWCEWTRYQNESWE